MGYHHTLDDSLAECIGECTLHTVARFNLDGSLSEYEQHQESIVAPFLAYAPMSEQLGGKFPRLGKTYRLHSHNRHLGDASLFEPKECRIYLTNSLRREYPIGIANKVTKVRNLHIGHGFGGIVLSHRRLQSGNHKSQQSV